MNRYDLQRIARARVKEAKVLIDNGQFSGAYYLLGYAVECALKACIAKRTKRYDFPDRKLANDSHTHDLARLLIAAGLKRQFDADSMDNPRLASNWTIVKDWSSEVRYNIDISGSRAREMYSAVNDRSMGMLTWLKKWW